jgi:hypothetical protein
LDTVGAAADCRTLVVDTRCAGPTIRLHAIHVGIAKTRTVGLDTHAILGIAGLASLAVCVDQALHTNPRLGMAT